MNKMLMTMLRPLMEKGVKQLSEEMEKNNQLFIIKNVEGKPKIFIMNNNLEYIIKGGKDKEFTGDPKAIESVIPLENIAELLIKD